MKKGVIFILFQIRREQYYYIGVTSDLSSRIYQYKNGEGSVFTKKYKCTDLVYFEFFEDIESAIVREKNIKKWKRSWKDRLIKKMNPTLRDLYEEVIDFR